MMKDEQMLNDEQIEDAPVSRRSKKNTLFFVLTHLPLPLYAGAGFVGLVLLGLVFWNGGVGGVFAAGFPGANGGGYQAVFLVNNQVYFGKLKNYSKEYIVLRDVFYLQTAQALQDEKETSPRFSLAKLGNELHGPEDKMFIPKARILFWENMKADSQVAQLIAAQKK